MLEALAASAGRLLRGFSLRLLRIFRGGIRRPKLTLTIALLGALALGLGLPRIKLVLSIHDLVESNLGSLARLNELNRDFKEGKSSLVQFFPADGTGRAFRREELCAIRSWLRRQSAVEPELTNVISPFHLRQASLENGRLWFPRVLSESCEPAELARLAGSPWDGLLLDPGAGFVGAELVFRDARSERGLFDPGPVERLIARLQADFGDSGIRALHFGSAPYLYHALQGLNFTRVLNLIAIGVLLGVFRILFGTFRSGLLFVGTLLFSGVLLYGLMGWSGAPIDILSNGLFLLMAISTLEDFVFLSYLQMTEGGPWRRQFRVILVASFFTSLTTLIGFGSLYASDLAVIRRFGTLAAAAAAIEWATLFLVLPAVLRLAPRLRTWTRPERARLRSLTAKVAALRPGRWLRWGAAALFVGGIAFSPWLNFQDDPARAFPPWHPLSRDHQEVSRRLGWSTSMSVVFEPGVPEEKMRAVLAKIGARPEIKRIESPFEIESWMAVGLPRLTSELVRREFRSTSFSRRYFSADGQVRANLLLSFSDVRGVRRLLSELAPLCENETVCHFAGEVPSYAEFGDRVPLTLISSLALCLSLVLGVLAFLCLATGTRPLLPVLYTSIWGPLASLALLAASQFRVNFLTGIYVSALVGLAGDNAIQFIFAGYRKDLGHGLRRFGGASVQITLAMAVTALVFLFSKFLQAKALGGLLALGLLICLAGDLWLLSALLGGGGGGTPGKRR
ncbi:MAG: hypothetical protein NDJ89_17160 [Oligoflexia bacterium]|nr:hypothetical protein [Oligoflexia bacterium]